MHMMRYANGHEKMTSNWKILYSSKRNVAIIHFVAGSVATLVEGIEVRHCLEWLVITLLLSTGVEWRGSHCVIM